MSDKKDPLEIFRNLELYFFINRHGKVGVRFQSTILPPLVVQLEWGEALKLALIFRDILVCAVGGKDGPES